MIDEEGRQLGVLGTAEAWKTAVERGKDLIEIGPEQDPPLCRVMDYGQYRWQVQQQEKDGNHD